MFIRVKLYPKIKGTAAAPAPLPPPTAPANSIMWPKRILPQWARVAWQGHANKGRPFGEGKGWVLVVRHLTYKISAAYPSNPRRQVIPSQRGPNESMKKIIFIAANVGFSSTLTFDVIL